jgi:sigma-B regulation protein RsbU (phosphoserine phosphatase)
LSPISLRRFLVLLRRTSPLDRIALAVLALTFVSRVVAALGKKLPYSSLLGFLSFVAIVYLVIRLVPWFRTHVMWPLRNRLIVAYVFIAVVPVILLFSMVGVAAYGLYLQLGAHLLHDDFEEHISRIMTDADAFAAAIEQEAAKGISPQDESVLSRPDVARLITAARTESPDLKVFLNHGTHLIERGDGHKFSGLVEWNEKPWIASALKREGPAGVVTILVAEPVNSTFIDSFSSELGPIQLIFLRPAGDKHDPNFNFTFNGRVYVPGEQVSSRRRTLAPAENFLDARVAGASTLELAHMESDRDQRPAAVLASFSLRPSAVNRRLFTSVGDVGPLLVAVLVGAGIIFLVLEITALITGVVLTRTITTSIGDLYEATLHVRRGDLAKRVRVRQRDQLGALGDSFNEMTSSISELIDEQRQRQRLENEISIAREVQSQLFPQSLPSLPGLQLGAICRPARVVSGDYYDFIKTGPDRLGIALADISGKGIFAALLMASLQAALRSTAMLDGNGGTADLVSKLNRHVFRNTSDDRYATFFYAVYDEQARTLTYTNAGHLAPFFIHEGNVQELEEGGTVVGLFEEFPFTQGVIRVEPGSLLVLFSDGLTEPENVYGEEFGRLRVRAEILRQANLPPQRLAENLIAAAEQWAGSPEQADDITVVVARMG